MNMVVTGLRRFGVMRNWLCMICLQVRTKNFEPSLDLGAYEGLALRLKGDGLRYKCTIRTDTNWDGIGYTL